MTSVETAPERSPDGQSRGPGFPADAHLGFVVHVARGFRGGGLPLEDLVGEGCVGLMLATRRFDPSRGARFTTYAAYWVRKTIVRALDDKVRVVRVPRDARRNGAISREVWIDAAPPSSAADSSRRRENQGVSPLDELILHERRDGLRRSMSLLSRRERAVLELRFGLRDGRERTLRQTGERLGLSQEGARIVEKRALARLRAAFGVASAVTAVSRPTRSPLRR